MDLSNNLIMELGTLLEFNSLLPEATEKAASGQIKVVWDDFYARATSEEKDQFEKLVQAMVKASQEQRGGIHN